MRIWWGSVCVLACATGIAGEVPLGCKTFPLQPNDSAAFEDLSTGRLPIPDYATTLANCLKTDPFRGSSPVQVPKSAWLEAERTRYAAVLATQPVDVLVVPFQIQGYGLDRIERALMAADLAYAIGDAGALKVADPFLTALALGEGERRLDSQAIRDFAQKIGASKILYAYVGHDLKHTFTLTLALHDLAAAPGARPWQRDWRSTSFSDERTPAYVFHEMLPSVLKELPLGLDPKSSAVVRIAPVPARIDAAPLTLVSTGNKTGSDLATMSLLASLVPAGAEIERERLFERVLLTALRANVSKPEQRFFEAYALLNLDRRPVALARLQGASGASIQALRALLDGNLPAARSATSQVTSPLEQLLLQFKLRDLEYAYAAEEPSNPTAVAALFGEQVLPAWELLLTARIEDGNRWFASDAESIKQALDRTFPIAGLGLDSLIRGNAAVGKEGPGDVAIDLANTRHARGAAAGLKVQPCCRTQDLRPGRWDLLWLLEAVAQDRINRNLEQRIFVKAAPDAALADIARYDALFAGHPRMAALTAHAAHRVSERSPDDERSSWMARAEQSARAALQWSPGQNRTAFVAAVGLGIPSQGSALLVDVYGYDFPRRASWPGWFMGIEQPAGQAQWLAFFTEAMAFSTSDLSLLNSVPAGADKIIAALGARFTGNPRKPPSQAPAQPGDRLAAARAAAKEDPDKYLTLGLLLLNSDRPFQEAQDAFLAYPAFQQRTARDRVALSNRAYDVGSRFFWLGQAEMAKPFFKIAADLDTGSEASMGSRQRILLLEGDYIGAAEMALQRSMRYSSAYAQRDYLSLLHAFSQHETAWNAFAQLRAGQSGPALWASATVGHRMQKHDEPAVRAWLKTPEIRNAKFKAQLFASYFALLWYSTDRLPPPDLGALVAELEGNPVAHIDPSGVARPHPVAPEGFEIVRPTFVPPTAATRPPDDTPVSSERFYFADAYSAVVRGEYSKAVERFGAMAQLYPIDGVPMSYFAYAAARTGDTLQFEKYVATSRPHDDRDFDVMLSRAFFAAGRKQLDEAHRLLALAFRNKPYVGDRPLDVDYQFAQACEWLYRDTKDARFATTLLEWARSYQSMQPAMAWSYAVQYQYESNPEVRTRALAMTLHLDPLSARIHKAPKAEVEKARVWFSANNPFRLPSEEHKAAPVTAAAL